MTWIMSLTHQRSVSKEGKENCATAIFTVWMNQNDLDSGGVQEKYQRPGGIHLDGEEADPELEDDGQDADLHQGP